jgi:hypothetical protein
LNTETHAFIIRIWCEPSGEAERPIMWRGSVEHVGKNQRIYFSDLKKAVQFIQAQIKLMPPPERTDWKAAWKRLKNKIMEYYEKIGR